MQKTLDQLGIDTTKPYRVVLGSGGSVLEAEQVKPPRVTLEHSRETRSTRPVEPEPEASIAPEDLGAIPVPARRRRLNQEEA